MSKGGENRRENEVSREPDGCGIQWKGEKNGEENKLMEETPFTCLKAEKRR